MDPLIFKESSSAIKWLLDKLLKLNQRKQDLERKKVNQIADFLLQISEILDKVVIEINNNNLPSREYYELDHISTDLYFILSDVDKKIKGNFSEKFTTALERAIHTIVEHDSAQGYAPGVPKGILLKKLYNEGKTFGKTGEIIVNDIMQVAAMFSAESKKLKAKN